MKQSHSGLVTPSRYTRQKHLNVRSSGSRAKTILHDEAGIAMYKVGTGPTGSSAWSPHLAPPIGSMSSDSCVADQRFMSLLEVLVLLLPTHWSDHVAATTLNLHRMFSAGGPMMSMTRDSFRAGRIAIVADEELKYHALARMRMLFTAWYQNECHQRSFHVGAMVQRYPFT
ncbi:hypothetical protein F1559_004084 [Cyanidiococcus yangmingshanensis]|uniref:Uncharacterized protein n=1 Tax=Cyanidiococcus yangmingshanensis TaxID=2690220 RepID=A0A7J7IF83_9RHOD|nr:hypothetical protein F1559_004084 [Cyanidiococcus yangmingshanensis]